MKALINFSYLKLHQFTYLKTQVYLHCSLEEKKDLTDYQARLIFLCNAEILHDSVMIGNPNATHCTGPIWLKEMEKGIPYQTL